MEKRHLAIAVTRSAGSIPPLAKTGDGRIVQSHFGIDSAQPPATLAHAHRHLGILTGNHRWIVEIDLAKRPPPKQRVPATPWRLADRHIPLIVTQRVVDRALRIALTVSPK